MPEKANRPNAPSGSDSTKASRGQLSMCLSVDAIASGSRPSIDSASVSTCERSRSVPRLATSSRASAALLRA